MEDIIEGRDDSRKKEITEGRDDAGGGHYSRE